MILCTICTIAHILKTYIKNKAIFIPTVGNEDRTDPNEILKALKQIDENNSFNEITITTEDKYKLGAIIIENPSIKNWMIISHGNAGNIYHRINMILQFVHFTNILVYDYRGYGKSTGSPDEYGTYKDIYACWKYLINKNILAKDITLYGESLGSAISLWLGQKLAKEGVYPRSIISQCGLSSIKNYVKIKLKYVLRENTCKKLVYYFLELVGFIVGDAYNSVKNIKNIPKNVPILIAHSPHDEVTEYEHSNLLMNARQTKTSFFKLNSSHCPEKFEKRYIDAIENFINYKYIHNQL